MPLEESSQVAWSMDIDLLQKISNNLGLADEYYLLGKYDKTFAALRTCKFDFIQSLDKAERDKLKKIEQNMELAIYSHRLIISRDTWENNTDYSDETKKVYYKIIAKFGNKAQEAVEDYREMIMDLLNKYGYLAKLKADKSRLGM